ncbi:hypothetical protein GOBAR_AA08383 [Gossypium barbadense]|uniref:Uncharacterized protein n=1 Tax=Gossypium barbadense TaxID=3634 RepID=A0A2P5Y9K3_GOSBA|nr:hypothetical protein GOBAR_AA08383 [Gossypium barbadense]
MLGLTDKLLTSVNRRYNKKLFNQDFVECESVLQQVNWLAIETSRASADGVLVSNVKQRVESLICVPNKPNRIFNSVVMLHQGVSHQDRLMMLSRLASGLHYEYWDVFGYGNKALRSLGGTATGFDTWE